ncbi:MAG TPA: type IV pilin protein [Burkholderiaceae bacterium]|jgi:type IV pilus assembly protein PilE
MPARRTHRASQGFTLIELMVTVAIIAIIASVAIPQYKDYVTRGALADASTGLAALRADMERYYQDNRSYAPVNGFTPPCAGTGNAVVFGTFTISCKGAPTATAYTLQALGSKASAGFTFTVDQNDTRATATAPTGWNTCATKWLMKKGDPCS